MTPGVVVIGTAVVDVIGYAERRPGPGETVVGRRYEVAAGGKGLNQAIAAARAGVSTSLIAAIGDDGFGSMLSATLKRERVATDATIVRPDNPTGVGLPIVTDDGENSIVVVPGASSEIGADHHRWMNAHISPGTLFVSQLELPMEVVGPALAIAAQRGATILLNPAPAADVSSLIDQIDVLVPNTVEAERLTGISDPRRAALALARLREGLKVAVTCGRDGALFVHDGEVNEISAPAVEAIDTVGAGDVFCGYLAAQLWEGLAWSEAVAVSVRAASISVTRRGAATSAPHRAELAQSYPR